LETCAALALLVSDAVPASTFDRRPPTRWQPSSDSNPRLSSQWWCVSPARRCGSNLASAIAVLLYRFTA